MTRAGFGCRWLTCLCGGALRLPRGMLRVECSCGAVWHGLTGRLVDDCGGCVC